MNFTIPKAELSAALARCAAIAGGVKSSMPILSHVLLQPSDTGLIVKATDLEVGYSAAVGNIYWIDTCTGKEEAFLLPAKRLHDCVKAIPIGEVTFFVNDNIAKISGGTASFTLTGLDADDFPQITLAGSGGLTFIPSALGKTLRAVAYCHSKDETKYNLNGCHLLLEANVDGQLFAVTTATDGHRLCFNTEGISPEEDDSAALQSTGDIPPELLKGVIIPAKGIVELVKLDSSEPGVLNLVGNTLIVSLGDEVLTLQLVEGDFPDASRVIPKDPQHTISVKRQALIEALDRCKIITDKDSRGVNLELHEGRLMITSTLDSIGAAASDFVTAETTGEPPAMRFNVDYLLQALTNLTSSRVDIAITSDLYPIIITGSGTDFPQAILMPMRAQS